MCTCSDQCQTIERARPIQYLNSVIYFLTHIFSVVLCSMENEQSVCRSFSLWTMKTRVLKTETTQVAIHSSSSRPHVRCAFKFKIAFTTHVCKKFYGFSNTIILTNKMEKIRCKQALVQNIDDVLLRRRLQYAMKERTIGPVAPIHLPWISCQAKWQ